MSMTLPDFGQASVLVVGDIMLDRYIWGTVDCISPEVPIPMVHVQDRTSRLGGAGKVAANLAQEDQAAILSARGFVDALVLFDEDIPLILIKALKPDVLVKGGDYTPATVIGVDLMPAWGCDG